MTNPVQLAAMVRSRYTGDNVRAVSEVIDQLERTGEITLYPTEDEPGYSDRGHDDYWTDFWLTVESENYHSIISHDSIVKQIQE